MEIVGLIALVAPLVIAGSFWLFKKTEPSWEAIDANLAEQEARERAKALDRAKSPDR